MRVMTLLAIFAGLSPAWRVLHFPWEHIFVLRSRHLCWCVISPTIMPSGHLRHDHPTLSLTTCCSWMRASTEPTTPQPTDSLPPPTHALSAGLKAVNCGPSLQQSPAGRHVGPPTVDAAVCGQQSAPRN